MWVEKLTNGKFKYIERYVEPYTEKTKKTSITLDKGTAQAKKQALTLLQEKIDKLTNTNNITAKITLSELYEEWFSRYKITVKQRSALATSKAMKKVFVYVPKNNLVKNLDCQIFLDFFDRIYSFGNLSYAYTIQIKNTLGNMLNYAVEREYIDKNPISSIKIKRKKDQEENHKQKMDEKFLEREEINDIITYLKKNKNSFLHARIVEFLWLTGLRYGELQALQWKNYNGTSIEVNGTLGINNEKISPKTVASNRIVDLPQKAKDILQETKAANKLYFDRAEPDDYIFLSNRNLPLGVQSFNRILKKAEKECNINKSLSSHIFRHSHVSLLAELNLPLKSIMERVGHSNANTTLKIYNHVTKKTREEVIEALNNI